LLVIPSCRVSIAEASACAAVIANSNTESG
jgi:hypothetical protein